MINIDITETQGSTQVTGPDTTVNYNVSGSVSGDSVFISGAATEQIVNVGVTETPDNVIITGTASGDAITIRIAEGTICEGDGCFSSQFTYSSDGDLLSKTSRGKTTTYSYYAEGALYQSVNDDCSKTMYYDESGLLTGILAV